jgi:hypothetical protein
MDYVTVEEFSEVKKMLGSITESLAKLGSSNQSNNGNETQVEYQDNIPISQLASLTTQVNELNKKNQDLELEVAKEARKAEYKEIESFVEQQINERRILPKDKKSKVDLLKAIPNEETMKYTDSEGRTLRKSSRQVLMESIIAGPQLWSDGEIPSGYNIDADPTAGSRYRKFGETNIDPDSIKLDGKIREYAVSIGLKPDDPVQYIEAYDQYTFAFGITN